MEENRELISDESKLVDIFNNHYINIVESTTGTPPTSIGDPSDPNRDRDTVKEIIDKFDRPIIVKYVKISLTRALELFLYHWLLRKKSTKL